MSDSINVALGFNLSNKGNIDARKDNITTLEQLKNWDVATNPIPNGFMIYLDKVIYIYDESNEVSETTGKFAGIADSYLYGDITSYLMFPILTAAGLNWFNENKAELRLGKYIVEIDASTSETHGIHMIYNYVDDVANKVCKVSLISGDLVHIVVLNYGEENEFVSGYVNEFAGGGTDLFLDGSRTYSIDISNIELQETAISDETLTFFNSKYFRDLYPYYSNKRLIVDGKDECLMILKCDNYRYSGLLASGEWLIVLADEEFAYEFSLIEENDTFVSGKQIKYYNNESIIDFPFALGTLSSGTTDLSEEQITLLNANLKRHILHSDFVKILAFRDYSTLKNITSYIYVNSINNANTNQETGNGITRISANSNFYSYQIHLEWDFDTSTWVSGDITKTAQSQSSATLINELSDRTDAAFSAAFSTELEEANAKAFTDVNEVLTELNTLLEKYVLRGDMNQEFSEISQSFLLNNLKITDMLRYSSQYLTEEQQAQVKTNLGISASSGVEVEVVSELGQSTTSVINQKVVTDNILELQNEVFPITAIFNVNETLFEVGRTSDVVLTWRLERKGNAITPQTITLDGVEVTGIYKVESVNATKTFTLIQTYNGTPYSKDVTVTFSSMSYYGVTTMAAPTAPYIKVMNQNLDTNKGFSASFTGTQTRAVYAYPKSYGALTSILDPNGFENISGFNRTEVDITSITGQVATYYVYTSAALSNFSSFTFRFI